MITLYGMFSPNVFKIALMLEEAGLPYRTEHVPVMCGGNRTSDFLKLNPLAKVPVIVDPEGPLAGQALFESGAILIYLAENYASALLPRESDDPGRWRVLTWLAVQMALAGPMLGQMNHFQGLPAEKKGYAYGRYRDQARFVYERIDGQLTDNSYLGGAAYSIADIAMYPWAAYMERHGFARDDFRHLMRWRSEIDERPATARALKVMMALMQLDGESLKRSTPQDVDRFFNRSAPGPLPDGDAYFALGPMVSARPAPE